MGGSDGVAMSEIATTTTAAAAAAAAAVTAGTAGTAIDTPAEEGGHDSYLNIDSVVTVQETRLGSSSMAAGHGPTTATSGERGSGNGGIKEPQEGVSWFHRTMDQSGSVSLLKGSRAAGAESNFLVRPGKKSGCYYLMVLDDKGRPWQAAVTLDPQTNTLKVKKSATSTRTLEGLVQYLAGKEGAQRAGLPCPLKY